MAERKKKHRKVINQLGADHEVLKCCRVTLEKLTKKEFYKIRESEVKELFWYLDRDKSGTLEADEVQALEEHICEEDSGDQFLRRAEFRAIIEQCDKDQDKRITAEEFHHALTEGDVGLERMVNKIKWKAHEAEHGILKPDEVSRETVLSYLKASYTKDQSCMSLPTTLFFFFCFTYLVLEHLRIEFAYLIHTAVIGEVSTYLWRDVHDVPSMWAWIEDQYAGGALPHHPRNVPWSVPGRIGHFNQIIGAVQFNINRYEEFPCGYVALTDVYNNPLYRQTDQCTQSLEPADMTPITTTPMCPPDGTLELPCTPYFLLYGIGSDEVLRQIHELRDSGWVDRNTESVDCITVTYNAEMGMYTYVKLNFKFNRSGLMKITFSTESVDAQPYRNQMLLFFDVMYLVRILYMSYMEMKELIPAAQNGWDGIVDYMEFWNVIDWLSIFSGIWIATLWSGLVAHQEALSAEILNLPTLTIHDTFSKPEEIDYAGDYETRQSIFISEPDYFDKVYAIHNRFGEIADHFYTFRVAMWIFTFVLMFKFFKAFRANPKLQVATATLARSATDIIHFLVVFFAIFMSFAVISHTSFGYAMYEFHSLGASLNTCFEVLMGAFDYEAIYAVDPMVGTIWFIMFNTIVLFVLLNILLAIIMDTYVLVKGEEEGADSIITQAKKTWKEIQVTSGPQFQGLWPIICEFEDDDEPAHPPGAKEDGGWGPVSSDSLRAAFQLHGRPEISYKQASYIVNQAYHYAIEQREKGTSVRLSDALRCVAKLSSMSKRQEETLGRAQGVMARLKHSLQHDMRRPPPPLPGQLSGASGAPPAPNALPAATPSNTRSAPLEPPSPAMTPSSDDAQAKATKLGGDGTRLSNQCLAAARGLDNALAQKARFSDPVQTQQLTDRAEAALGQLTGLRKAVDACNDANAGIVEALEQLQQQQATLLGKLEGDLSLPPSPAGRRKSQVVPAV